MRTVDENLNEKSQGETDPRQQYNIKVDFGEIKC